MSTWRDRVAARLPPGIARVTVIADPDGLLGDEALVAQLLARGQTLLRYEDPVAFRRAWQALRARWSAGAQEEVLVAVQGDASVARGLPFDVVRSARIEQLRTYDLFSTLPPAHLTSLPRAELDRVDALAAKRGTGSSQRAELERAQSIARRLDALSHAVPEPTARHGAWVSFAETWGALNALRWEGDGTPWHHARFESLRARMDAAFDAWVTHHYGELHSLPADPPVMVHHVPRAMERWRARTGGRVALVVLDGMAFDQWDALARCAGLRPSAVSGVFAWVPTTTAVSRQSLFAGEVPSRIADRLQGTSGEPSLWKAFWARRDPRARTGYLRGLGDGPLDAAQSVIDEGADALGLVVDLVDRLLHGAELGLEGVHTQLRLWARSGWLQDLLARLRGGGYTVFLTADHGNIEAVGRGTLRDGGWAEVRGERARIYGDAGLRDAAAGDSLRRWSAAGLPPDFHVALAPERTAFVEEGRRAVVHGGASLEELIVPLVRFDV